MSQRLPSSTGSQQPGPPRLQNDVSVTLLVTFASPIIGDFKLVANQAQKPYELLALSIQLSLKSVKPSSGTGQACVQDHCNSGGTVSGCIDDKT